MRSSSKSSPPITINRFSAPQADPPQILYRERIVDSLLQDHTSRIATIILTAQPGLGKTTLIKQFLDRITTASVWYQVGPDDADPNFFLHALSACIKRLPPNYPASVLDLIPEQGGMPCALRKRIDALLQELSAFLQDDLYLVFDDLHHLVPHASSMSILQHLLATAPPRLHFILSSREPLPGFDEQVLCRTRTLLHLDNRALAMDENEIADFFHQALHLAVPLHTIKEVARVTEGWIQGIHLLGLHMEQRHRQSRPTVPLQLEKTDQQQIRLYFQLEILPLLNRQIRPALLILSLLDSMSVDLAIELTGKPDIGRDLEELVRRNLFLHPPDPENGTFGLHSLFQQFLREMALKELGIGTVRELYRRAGQFFLKHDNPAQALHYLLTAEAYDLIETVLKNHGMVFLKANQTAALGALLGRISESCLRRLGWSSFFLALAHMDSTPILALPLLDQALALFAAQHDEIGELLCLTHNIAIRIITTGHYRGGEELLHRAVELFSRVAETLEAFTTILVTHSLAMGYCIFLGDVEEATRYASLALALAQKGALVNFEAALLLVMGYIRIFAGHTSLARMYLEQAAPYVHHFEVGAFNSLAIRMMLFNFLFHDGDFPNYFEQKHRTVDVFGLALFSQSIAGPFCYIWEMDIAISQGHFEKTLALAEEALTRYPTLSPHLAGQVLQLQAVALSRQQHYDQAVSAITESQRLRDLSGGRYFITLNALLAGVVFCRCGHHEQGISLLNQGIEEARQMPTEYLEACGLLHRASILLTAGLHARAREDIATGMRLMRRNSYRHFWAWDPVTREQVFSFAVARSIEPAYARILAGKQSGKALLKDGTPLPLLDIQTLGEFTIACQGAILLRAEQLTPQQRELLALLLAAPDMKKPQEDIQLSFWPDSTADAVKVKFDTLVSRLRKTLTEALPGNSAHLYFNREKGILWLTHCRVDAHAFLYAAGRGMHHFRLHEYWQAGTAFTTAEALWQGEFVPGVTGEDRIRAFRDTLVRAFSEMTVAWCDLLVGSNRRQQAIQAAEKALLNDPLNDRLYSLLYRLQGQHSAIHARRVLKRFEAALQREGYPDAEIAELVAEISTDQRGTNIPSSQG